MLPEAAGEREKRGETCHSGKNGSDIAISPPHKLVLTHSMEDYVISHKTTGLLIIVWTISFNGYTLTYKVRLNALPIMQGVVYEAWLHLGIYNL